MIWAILVSCGIPSALVGILFKKMEKANRERKKYELCMVKLIMASTKLGEANAIALQKGACNGETQSALKYLTETKHELKDFLMEAGIDHIF